MGGICATSLRVRILSRGSAAFAIESYRRNFAHLNQTGFLYDGVESATHHPFPHPRP